MKSRELTGADLDRWVAKAEHGIAYEKALPYSMDWALAGPIIERQGIGLIHNSRLRPNPHDQGWQSMPADSFAEAVDGPTALVAAMRAYVVLKFGEEV